MKGDPEATEAGVPAAGAEEQREAVLSEVSSTEVAPFGLDPFPESSGNGALEEEVLVSLQAVAVGAVDVVVIATAIRAKEQATVPESPEKVAYLLPSCRVPDVAPDGGPGRGGRRGQLEGR